MRFLLRNVNEMLSPEWYIFLYSINYCMAYVCATKVLAEGVKGKNVLVISTCLLVQELVEEGALQPARSTWILRGRNVRMGTKGARYTRCDRVACAQCDVWGE